MVRVEPFAARQFLGIGPFEGLRRNALRHRQAGRVEPLLMPREQMLDGRVDAQVELGQRRLRRVGQLTAIVKVPDGARVMLGVYDRHRRGGELYEITPATKVSQGPIAVKYVLQNDWICTLTSRNQVADGCENSTMYRMEKMFRSQIICYAAIG